MRAFLALLARDLGSPARLVSSGQGLLFFLAVVVLLPLAAGPDAALLHRLAAGILWIALLLASLCGLEALLREDWEDGSLEAMALSALPLEAVVLAKCLGHWLANLVPLAVLSVPCGLLLQLDIAGSLALAGAMLALTPAFSLLAGLGAVLTLDVRRGGMLALLLVLPLQMPVLIFGVAASGDGAGSTQGLLLGLGIALVLLAVVPFFAAGVLWRRLRI